MAEEESDGERRDDREQQAPPRDDKPDKGDGGDGGQNQQDKKDQPEDKDPKKAEEDRKKQEKKQKAKRILHNPLIWMVAAVVLLALIVLLIAFWLYERQFVSTDDAYVDGRIVHVAPQISGVVTRVYVTDNQFVPAGTPLVDIDTSDARVRLAQAEAARQRAIAQIAEAQAQIGVSRANLDQARAQISGAAADEANASADLSRYTTLRRINPGAVSQQQIDQAATRLAEARSQRRQAEKQAASRAAEIKASITQVGTARAGLADARAQQQSANVTLSDTRLYASVAGHVTKRTVAVGTYLQPGQEVMALVPQEIWVTANFKETQLKNMRLGQPVNFKVDAYPEIRFRGHVESIQHGAGQAFALLPAQNATGNFVKVVQRVPVKIVIDGPGDIRFPLGPGMSVKPRVKVR
jgi:membrane fusion protein (multidrug efflux system)